jgi:hypothetical protein
VKRRIGLLWPGGILEHVDHRRRRDAVGARHVVRPDVTAGQQIEAHHLFGW